MRRALLVGLAVFDLVLGATALFAPDLYLSLMHPRYAGGATYLLARTGAIWLVFAAVEAAAAVTLRRELVLVVAALRLMDVPADLVYLLRAPDQGWFGVAALVISPMVNLAVGLGLLRHRHRHRRQRVDGLI
jgi:hypothetical protein